MRTPPPSLNSFAVTRLSWVSREEWWSLDCHVLPETEWWSHGFTNFKPEWWSQDCHVLPEWWSQDCHQLQITCLSVGSDISLDGRFPQHYLASERKWCWKTFVTSTMHSEIGHLLCDAYHTHEVLLSSRHLLALAWGTTGESATMETLSWKRWFNHFWSTL